MTQLMFTYSFLRAVLFMGCFFLLASCENSKEEVDAAFGKKSSGIEEAYQIDSYLSQDGKTKARLTAPYMLRQVKDSQYMEFPRSMHVDFYDTTGVIETILNAKYGKYKESESKVLLRDSVIVINIKNGDTLRTPELWWDQNKQEFFTDKPSHITKRDGTDIFSRNGMKAKQDLSWYELYGNSGVLPTPDDMTPATDSLHRDSASHSAPPPPTPVKQEPVKQQPVPTPATPAPVPAPGSSTIAPPNGFMRRTDSMRAERKRRMGLFSNQDPKSKPVQQP
ncbi:MAG: LPS export ABC transporter periplasmic protein LptC [Chitinophagaceae bacterium]|nr:LPS export ABC transporter periplasmic protein LptC [Chitinophagaceae bacterium]